MIAKLFADHWIELGDNTSERLVRLATKVILVAAFGSMSLHFLTSAANPESYSSNWHINIVRLLCAAIIIYMLTRAWRTERSGSSWITYGVWLIAYALLLPFALLYLTLGDNQIDTILIYLEHNEFGDATMVAHDGFKDYINNQFLMFAALCGSAAIINQRMVDASKALWVLILLALLASPLTSYLAQKIVPNQLHASFDPQTEVAGVKIIGQPTKPMNLITIYLESLEQTYAEIDETRPLMEPLMTLAAQSAQASNLHQTIGGDTTIAGMVSTQCGVPLLPHGLNNVFYKYNKDNRKSIAFMPQVTCLSDQLAADGYTQHYMNGASLDAFGKRDFWTQHGGVKLFGLKSLPEDQIGNDRNFWGMNDDFLFDKAAQQLRTLNASGAPFSLTLLTLATHGPDGFSSPKCNLDLEVKSSMARAIACTAKTVRGFVETALEDGLLDNTLVVILSDHLAYENAFDDQLNAHADSRRNLFFMYNSAVPTPANREGLTIDIYPTILTAMGYQLENGRANMGVALQSETASLISEYKSDGLRKLLKGNRKLAAYLWRQSQ